MSKFYEVISELNINLENRLLSVCEGDHAGEKMIVSGGIPVWMSDESGLFAGYQAEAMAAEDGSLSAIAGESVFAELLGNEKKDCRYQQPYRSKSDDSNNYRIHTV